VITLGPEVCPMGQIWACDRENRWLLWDQRLDRYGHVIEEIGHYIRDRDGSHGTNMGIQREQVVGAQCFL
jgi:hypothetical protein